MAFDCPSSVGRDLDGFIESPSCGHFFGYSFFFSTMTVALLEGTWNPLPLPPPRPFPSLTIFRPPDRFSFLWCLCEDIRPIEDTKTPSGGLPPRSPYFFSFSISLFDLRRDFFFRCALSDPPLFLSPSVSNALTLDFFLRSKITILI